MKLFTYWRSSAAWRVRIALNLKTVAYSCEPVHLVRGEQRSAAYQLINPNAVVPALQLDDGTVLTQSLAIIEYLNELHPLPPLLPSDPVLRARVRAAAQLIACDIHPVNNLRVVDHLKSRLGHTSDEATMWMRHWMRAGLEAYLRSIDRTGNFSFGDTPTLADLCLVPQLFNARRWGMDFAGLERLADIDRAAAALPAFQAATPEAQPEADPSVLPSQDTARGTQRPVLSPDPK
jgi:maleylacetoacetate isomerase